MAVIENEMNYCIIIFLEPYFTGSLWVNYTYRKSREIGYGAVNFRNIDSHRQDGDRNQVHPEFSFWPIKTGDRKSNAWNFENKWCKINSMYSVSQ